MQCKVAIRVLLILLMVSPERNVSMPTSPLLITARCKDDDACRFTGRDMFLTIQITNAGKAGIGFPLAFVKKTGPIIRLIDSSTHKEMYLRKNPPDSDLLDKFTIISPGDSLSLEWVITSHELTKFHKEIVDVTVEITILTSIDVSGKESDFRGTTRLRIAGKSSP